MADSSLTEGDIKFALTVLQSAAKDPSFNGLCDWDAVVAELGYASAKSARDRWNQLRAKKLAPKASSASTTNPKTTNKRKMADANPAEADSSSAGNKRARTARASASKTASAPYAASTSNNTTTGDSAAMSKLETIALVFKGKILPMCWTFLADPPAHKEKRRQEAARLTLDIEQHVLLKYDGVDTQDSEAVRSSRKGLVEEARDWLARLDRVIEG